MKKLNTQDLLSAIAHLENANLITDFAMRDVIIHFLEKELNLARMRAAKQAPLREAVLKSITSFGKTATEIFWANPSLVEGYSTHQLVNVIRQMITEGSVERVETDFNKPSRPCRYKKTNN